MFDRHQRKHTGSSTGAEGNIAQHQSIRMSIGCSGGVTRGRNRKDTEEGSKDSGPRTLATGGSGEGKSSGVGTRQRESATRWYTLLCGQRENARKGKNKGPGAAENASCPSRGRNRLSDCVLGLCVHVWSVAYV